MSNSKQIDKLVDRAKLNEEEPLELIMPEPQEGAVEDLKPQEDEEELDSRSARRKLMASFDDDEGEKSDINGLSYVLSGDMLSAQWLRKQVGWMVLVVVLCFIYVGNRHFAQQQQIHNNRLKSELREAHYDAMARSSELMRKCRRSNIVERLSQDPYNTLKMPSAQPAVIPAE